MSQMDRLKSWSGKRIATITNVVIGIGRSELPWEITLEHFTKTRSSLRTRRTKTKKDALVIAKEWIQR